MVLGLDFDTALGKLIHSDAYSELHVAKYIVRWLACCFNTQIRLMMLDVSEPSLYSGQVWFITEERTVS